MSEIVHEQGAAFAPVVVFAYNRPQHTQQLLDSLAENSEASDTLLYVYCDGPKTDATTQDLLAISETREICRSEVRFRQLTIIERTQNLGLASSIISGVTEVVERHGTVVVLEDDLVLSKHFLKFMNEALQLYAVDDRVLSVGACNFFRNRWARSTTCFLPLPDCLGWATWRNRWRLFEPDGHKLLQKLEDEGLQYSFNLHGYLDFISMLKKQCDGKISSWAIRWQTIAYLKNMLTLYPVIALSQHRGSNNSTHYGQDICPSLAQKPIHIIKREAIVHERDYYCMVRGLMVLGDQNWVSRMKKRIRLFLTWRRKAGWLNRGNL